MHQKHNDNRHSRMAEGRGSWGHAVYIPARQPNHENACLPASLLHLLSVPLYMAVAHYVLMMQARVSRQDINAGFYIE
ncbi:hypothetical protein [Serratia grimesii]|uniref:hypothetical protein n=1 Tax=Serratia grimesii TaxID=82995 RepID=UPI0039AEA834